MKKIKKYLIILVMCVISLSAVGFSACTYGGNIKNVDVVDLGLYDGHRVELWCIEYKDKTYSEAPVPYFVGNNYICTFKDERQKIVVDKNYDLAAAVRNGDIQFRYLTDIAQKAQTAIGGDQTEPLINNVNGLTPEIIIRMKKGYADYLNQSNVGINNIEIEHFLGMYASSYAVILTCVPEDSNFPCDEVPVYYESSYGDSVYVCTFPDPTYKIIFFNTYDYKVNYTLQEIHIPDYELSSLAKSARIALGEPEEDSQDDDEDNSQDDNLQDLT